MPIYLNMSDQCPQIQPQQHYTGMAGTARPNPLQNKTNKAVPDPRQGSSLHNIFLIGDFPYLEVATLQPWHKAVDEHADVIALDAVGRQAKVIDDVRAYGQLLAGVRRL